MVYRKRVYKKRASKVAPKTAKVVKKIVKNELHKQIEDKDAELSLSVSQTLLDPIGNVYPLLTTGIVTGSDDGERIGSRILPKSLEMRFNFNNSSTTTNRHRIVVFRWHPDNTNYTPTAPQIFNSSGSDAQYNPQTRDQFTVLMDYTVDERDLSNGHQSYHKLLRKKLNLKQYMNFQASNSGACTNNLYAVVQSDVTESSSSNVIISMSGILFYEDA